MRIEPNDLAGAAQLSSDAVVELSKLVQAAQESVMRFCGVFVPTGPTAAINSLIHETLRGITRGVDRQVRSVCPPYEANQNAAMSPSRTRENVIAALNGVIGDHLAETANPLAIRMSVRRNGRALKLEKKSLRTSIPDAGSKLLVLVHGLCRNDLQWKRNGHDYGSVLARELGYTPVYLHYNSGLHISENGRAFSQLLETLVQQWPTDITELAIVAHSAGGLVSRSAHHYATLARHRWRRYLRHIVFIGTPHHGAPWERWGNLVNVSLDLCMFSAPYSRLAKLRSAGITDLRYGNVRDDDWHGRDPFAHSPDLRLPLPLPGKVKCYAVAAVSRKYRADVGDGIVPLDSALGRHSDPAMALHFTRPRQWIGHDMNHWDLLCHPTVCDRIRSWLQ